MMSPAAMVVAAPPPSPPPVAVPEPLADLLDARAKLAGPERYSDVFTRDAAIFAEENGRWWTGQERILDSIGNFPTALRFMTTSYALDGVAGHASGVLEDASGEDTHSFMLGLTRGADGRWRIASEMKQALMPAAYAPAVTAERVIEVLDDAGIQYATVLSLGFWFDKPSQAGNRDRFADTRAENDWVIAETAKYPDRLNPFCGINPLADYATAEIERCAAHPRVRGLKIHGQSRAHPSNPAHRERLQAFFRAANRHGLAIVIHLRGPVEPFIDHVFPEAPDVPIQIAHMGGSWENTRLIAAAIQAGKPGTKNLYFDLSGMLPVKGWWDHGNPWPFLGRQPSAKDEAEVVETLRAVGFDRILYGSDMSLPWLPTPRDWWRRAVLPLPLTDAEVRDIADNLPPYVGRRGPASRAMRGRACCPVARGE